MRKSIGGAGKVRKIMEKSELREAVQKKLGNTNSPSNSFLKNVYEGVLLYAQNRGPF